MEEQALYQNFPLVFNVGKEDDAETGGLMCANAVMASVDHLMRNSVIARCLNAQEASRLAADPVKRH